MLQITWKYKQKEMLSSLILAAMVQMFIFN